MVLMYRFLQNLKKNLPPRQLDLLKKTYHIFFPGVIRNYGIYERFLAEKNGLEIGGPSSIFKATGILPLYSIVGNLDGCNFSENTIWEGDIKKGQTYAYTKGDKKGYQYICDAGSLINVQSGKYDFVLASHVLEHIANPLKAFSEWLRVLKKDGLILLVVPHRDGTFDHYRPVALFQHLLEDYHSNVGEDDLTHLPEVLKLHDLSLDPPAGDYESFKKRSLLNYENRCLHHHVFNTRLVMEILNHFDIRILAIDLYRPHHIIILGKKQSKGAIEDNATFLSRNKRLFISSPFISDR